MVLFLLALPLLLAAWLVYNNSTLNADGSNGQIATDTASNKEAKKLTKENTAEIDKLDLVPQAVVENIKEPTKDYADFTIVGNIKNSLYSSFARHFDTSSKSEKLTSEKLAAHFKRLFFFDVNFKRDLRPDDKYAFIWEETSTSTDGIRILAALYQSEKLGKTFEAFYFKSSDDKFGRHYDSHGVEVQYRLKNAPLKDYEQVTSLLHDRRPRHNGIDFKGSVGLPIVLPYDAVVTRVSRRIKKGNGRFIAVKYKQSGLTALFLHCNTIADQVKVGKHLRASTKIATVGNTGHSFAPHLHYQVQRSPGEILNPYEVHGKIKRKINADSISSFNAIVAGYLKEMPDMVSSK